MSGQPAARITDSVVKGKIVTGSRTVLIGSQGGLACSVCPGGITVSSPVNPQLGAKVLLGSEDLDFALPSAALPVAWQRQYSSYVNPEHGAACGLLGHGWHLLQELSIRLHEESTLLLDASGRVITFDQPLVPGGQLHSASEDIWLLRGGSTEPDGGTAPWAANPRWSHVEQALVRNPQAILAVSGDGDTLWGFGPAPGEPVDGPWRLMAQIDRFGRRQLYHYSDGTTPEAGHSASKDPIPAGRLVSLSDGTGRRYRLLHQRIHGGKDAQGLNGLWGADDGWRVTGVDLTQDPLHPLSTPIALVRYGYSSAGDLITVHDRAGQLVREFEWDHHRISAHRHASGPWHRYRYESAQPGARVIEHSNQEGLSYRFDYLSQPPGPDGQPRAATRVSDSLDRIETYYFEGAAGLSRLIAHHKADGSRWLHPPTAAADAQNPLQVQRQWDSLGRLTALGTTGLQSTEGRDHLVQPLIGQILGRRYHYDSLGQLVAIEQAGAPGQAAQLLRYGYDSAGRLRAATDSQDPQITTCWQIDPAGNRLPAPGAPGQTNTQDNWAAQVHAHWRHTDFNLMGLGPLAGQRQGPVQRWEDNRIGFTEDRVWRYDPCGNRIAQMQADHSQQQLHYDGAHQLIAVRSSQIQGNAEQLRHHSRYTYDALGRRLKQQMESADSTESTRTHYYGWDGDRLIHTERLQHGDDTRHIEHTIYEPGSFTPWCA